MNVEKLNKLQSQVRIGGKVFIGLIDFVVCKKIYDFSFIYF